MTYVSRVERPKGLVQRAAWWFSRKKFGRIVEPLQATAHHPGVLLASGLIETVAGARWKRLDPHLRWLALQATAAAIGCSWCIDYSYYEGVNHGVDPRKVREITHWRESDAYDDRERAVLAYAEAVNATPTCVTSEIIADLHRYFDDAQIVELAAWIALENLRSRTNSGLGARSEGFAESCSLPPLVGQA